MVVAGRIEINLGVPHTCTDQLRVIAVGQVQTTMAYPTSFREIDDLTRVGGDEVLHVARPVVLDLIAAQTLEGHFLRHGFQFHEVNSIRRGVIIRFHNLEVFGGGYRTG